MTPSELKYNVESHNPDDCYFSRESMRFFGDTMRNYGVRTATIIDRAGNSREVWELWRKSPVKLNRQESAYFTKDTFKRISDYSNA